MIKNKRSNVEEEKDNKEDSKIEVRRLGFQNDLLCFQLQEEKQNKKMLQQKIELLIDEQNKTSIDATIK